MPGRIRVHKGISVLYYFILATLAFLLIAWIFRNTKLRSLVKSLPLSLPAYKTKNSVGPRSLADEDKMARYFSSRISIKYPDDNFGRLAETKPFKDSAIKFIGTAADCWLRLESEALSGVRPHHLGIVSSDSEFFVFEVKKGDDNIGPDYDWRQHPYETIFKPLTFRVGNAVLVIFGREKPFTIEGKNTNGVAVVNFEGPPEYGPITIGSSPDCYITLPDPDLPDYIGIMKSLSNHRYLYSYDGWNTGEEALIRADRYFEIAGYEVWCV
ncbi:hypothetical protein N9W89_12450 [Hellea sp.]|nr:hypothetical protein [Hellea sp.]